MKTLPAPSTATPLGRLNRAWTAEPPSPPNPVRPVPATVLIVPDASTLRIRLLSISAMKRLPALSTATPKGKSSCASVAGPPSPPNPLRPVPATVVIVPVASTLRIRSLKLSAMKRFPAPSTATPWGFHSLALTAGPLSRTA